MKLAFVALMVFAACGNGNGNGHYDTGGSERPVPAIDEPLSWYCFAVKASGDSRLPCYETEPLCEENRANAQTMNMDVGKCEPASSAVCFVGVRDKKSRVSCSREQPICEKEQKMALTGGYEVTACVVIKSRVDDSSPKPARSD